MARRVNWYLLNWERSVTRDESGRKHETWTYTGPYYSFRQSPRTLLHIKAAYLFLTAAMLAVWIVCSMVDVLGREQAYVGAAWFLCILPFMELILGTGSMLAVKEKMTYRAMYGAYQRCKYGSRILLALLSLSVLGQIIFLAIHHANPAIDLIAEVLWLAGAVVCTVFVSLIVLLQKRYPPQVI